MDTLPSGTSIDANLARLQLRLGQRAPVIALPGRILITEGVLFEYLPPSLPTANVRECFLCNDVLLIVASAGRSELSLSQIRLGLGCSIEDLDWRAGSKDGKGPPEDAFVINGADQRPVTLVTPDREYKALWLKHLRTALTKALPESVQLEPGWIHRFIKGTFWHAAIAGDFAIVNGLIALRDSGADCVDVNEVDADGMPPLHYAVASRNVLIARALLHASANIEAINPEYETPLHVASRLGDAPMVQLLCENGAQTDARDLTEQTALHVALTATALETGSGDDVVRILLEHGADANAADGSGLQPLHLVALNSLPHLVGVLVRHGASVSATFELACTSDAPADTYSVLHLACAPPIESHLILRGPTSWPRPIIVDLVSNLLAHGAPPNGRSGMRKLTPLHLVLMALRKARVSSAADATARAAGATSGSDDAALLLASLQFAASRLVASGARLDVSDAGGVTCGHLADTCGISGALDASFRVFVGRVAPAAPVSVVQRLEFALLSEPVAKLSRSLDRAFKLRTPGNANKRLGVAVDESSWATMADSPCCSGCGSAFTILKRRHHVSLYSTHCATSRAGLAWYLQ